MRSLVIAFIIIMSISCVAQNEDNKGTIKVKKPVTISVRDSIGELPRFPGGTIAMNNFIASNVIYPDSAKSNGINGTCYISFTINTDGSISNVKVLRGVSGCSECDKEAVRVIKLMPAFIPASKNGQAIRVQYNLPINFRLK
jgi:TonB family protein